MKMRKHTSAFTLIELVMVIVILGILAAVAVPRFFNLSNRANVSAEQGVVGGVRAGIQTYMANHTTNAWPSPLDSASNAACTPANACFTNVLSQGGITDDWTKVSATQYTGPAGNTFTYTPGTGNFN